MTYLKYCIVLCPCANLYYDSPEIATLVKLLIFSSLSSSPLLPYPFLPFPMLLPSPLSTPPLHSSPLPLLSLLPFFLSSPHPVSPFPFHLKLNPFLPHTPSLSSSLLCYPVLCSPSFPLFLSSPTLLIFLIPSSPLCFSPPLSPPCLSLLLPSSPCHSLPSLSSSPLSSSFLSLTSSSPNHLSPSTLSLFSPFLFFSSPLLSHTLVFSFLYFSSLFLFSPSFLFPKMYREMARNNTKKKKTIKQDPIGWHHYLEFLSVQNYDKLAFVKLSYSLIFCYGSPSILEVRNKAEKIILIRLILIFHDFSHFYYLLLFRGLDFKFHYFGDIPSGA